MHVQLGGVDGVDVVQGQGGLPWHTLSIHSYIRG